MVNGVVEGVLQVRELRLRGCELRVDARWHRHGRRRRREASLRAGLLDLRVHSCEVRFGVVVGAFTW